MIRLILSYSYTPLIHLISNPPTLHYRVPWGHTFVLSPAVVLDTGTMHIDLTILISFDTHSFIHAHGHAYIHSQKHNHHRNHNLNYNNTHAHIDTHLQI